MEELTLYYSVENGGDGSAYPVFFPTEELAEWHQNHLDIGWGESCTGSITVEGNNLKCNGFETATSVYLKLALYRWDMYGSNDVLDAEEIGIEAVEEIQRNEELAVEFKELFFPDGLPKWEIVQMDSEHLGICAEGGLPELEIYCDDAEKAKPRFQEYLNSL